MESFKNSVMSIALIFAIPICAYCQDELSLEISDSPDVSESFSEDALSDGSLEDAIQVQVDDTSAPIPEPALEPRRRRQRASNSVRLKSLVTDPMAARFMQGQGIVVRVPTPNRSVKSLLLFKSKSFKPQTLKIRSNTQLRGSELIVPVHRSVIDRLSYQPIRIGIYQSNVSVIRLVPTNRIMPGLDSVATVRRRAINEKYYLRLKPDNGVAVDFAGYSRFRITNDILDVELPFSQIEAIFFDLEEPGTANITLRNGNSISGKHNWPDIIEFATPWGDEKIESNRIVSLTRDVSIDVVPSGVENPKWVLQRQR